MIIEPSFVVITNPVQAYIPLEVNFLGMYHYQAIIDNKINTFTYQVILAKLLMWNLELEQKLITRVPPCLKANNYFSEESENLIR